MRMLLSIAALTAFASPLMGRDLIASATLTITMTVPPRPVTPDMEDGVYGSYELEKSGNTMHITSIE